VFRRGKIEGEGEKKRGKTGVKRVESGKRKFGRGENPRLKEILGKESQMTNNHLWGKKKKGRGTKTRKG